MQQFVDETVIEVSSGDGGHGKVSFRREKYVPKGGPDGGDGGKGGDVVFVVKKNLKTLSHLKYQRVYRAENGRPGRQKKMHGADGASVEVPVPPGTLLFDAETNDLIKDFSSEEDEQWVFLRGGQGGLGNSHFATSRRQTPRFAQPGIAGEAVRLRVELKLIADVGFVGFPNAGKSSLLAALTNAHPRVGAYPFTTKIPNLGVMQGGYRDVILADIPGIIEGASAGAGLGFRFLRHISRTFGIAFLVDLSDPEFLSAVDVLERELGRFEVQLLRKNRIIIGTKLDLEETSGRLELLSQKYTNVKVVGVSAFSGEGLEALKAEFLKMVNGSGRERPEDVSGDAGEQQDHGNP